MQEILRNADYHVDVAASTDQALNHLAARNFDVVVSDVSLSTVTGGALLKAVKIASPHAQVILTTNKPAPATMAEWGGAGAFDWLPKPISRERLLNTVANAARIKFLGDECQRMEEENRRYQEDLELLVDKRTEALCESEQKYRLLADNATDIIWTTDVDFNLTYVSPSVERIRGFTADEALKKPLQESMTPDSYKKARYLFEAEMRLVEKGDYTVGKSLLSEHELLHRDGSILCAEITMRLLFDSDMKPIGVLGISRDITKRKQTEQALRRSQKMDAFGQFTAGIAHDFNNILGIVLGSVELLRNQFSGDEEALERVDIIKTSAQRAADLTKLLLGFCRRQAAESAVTNLNRVIRRMQAVIDRFVTAEVEVEIRFGEDLWLTDIDPGEFEDALLNMSINALDAMPSGGRLTLETDNRTLDTAFCAKKPGVEPGQYVLLTVRDDGAGMLPAQQERIFEPFYTTKSDGNGLGLAMVFGFVQRSGGYIQVLSEPGNGTEFQLFLPVSQGQELPEETRDKHTEMRPHGAATVLVVDDEKDLLELARAALEALGYRILTASNATRALEVLGEEPGIDLLFSDVVMSGGNNGYELAQQAVARQPDLKVLLTSGFPDEAAANSSQARFTANLLRKPYSQSELANRLRELLIEPAQSAATVTHPTIDVPKSGVAAIDDVHDAIVALIESGRQAVSDGSESDCAIILVQLCEILRNHFPEEEAIMAACNYSGTDNHCQVHRLLVEQLGKKQRQRRQGTLGAREVLLFLTSWWIEHFHGIDRAFGSYCQNNPDVAGLALEHVASASEDF